MMSFSITTMLLVGTFASSSLANYNLVQDYTGAAFYEGFEWFTEADPTKGHVQFMDKAQANNSGFAGLMSGGLASNAVYLGMNAIDHAPEGRSSVRVHSSQTFNHGLFIADIVHMPGGICGTWPAFWLLGPDWPMGGEVDILEGVNDQASNKMVLHTGPDVSVSNENNAAFAGELLTANCDVAAPDQHKNAGCGILDGDNTTYGSGFNANGGGIFATEVTSTDIKIWFFTRDRIPADINAGNPAPSEDWGLPRADFKGDYQVDDHFRDLRLIFDTTLCGEWAGEVWSGSATCAALAPTCEQFVSESPEAFQEAYWAINSLQVFQVDESAHDDPNPQPLDAQDPQTPELESRSWSRGGAVIPAIP